MTFEEPTNVKRAAWALAATEHFADITMPGWRDSDTNDIDSAISDLVCDLAHLLRQRNRDPIEVVASCLGVFLAEEIDETDLAPEPRVTITIGD